MEWLEHNSHLSNWTFDVIYLTPVQLRTWIWCQVQRLAYTSNHSINICSIELTKLFASSLWEQQLFKQEYLKVQTFKINIFIFCKKSMNRLKITGTSTSVLRNKVWFVISLVIMPKSSTNWHYIYVMHEHKGGTGPDVMCHSEDQWAQTAGQRVLLKSRCSKCVSKWPTSIQITWRSLKQCVVCTEAQYGHKDELQTAVSLELTNELYTEYSSSGGSDQLSDTLAPGSGRS